jgi:hypothetical protein
MTYVYPSAILVILLAWSQAEDGTPPLFFLLEPHPDPEEGAAGRGG